MRLKRFDSVGWLVLLALLVGYGTANSAQSARSANKKGLKQYDKEMYDQSLSEFIAGSELAPDRPELKFNQGTALYKMQNFKEAVDQFQRSLSGEQPELSPDALYNLGNAYYRAGQSKEAVDAYKRSLMQQPLDADAKHNLEMALRLAQIQQQQQQQEQSQEKQEQQQEKQEQQQQEQQQQNEEQQQEQQSNGEMTEEQADRILDALQNEEQNALKDKLQRQFGKPKRVERDW